tara:strand:+ start:76722 stop:78698 length:1977 start_codon:yes stop_codon:yes gene_type:complete
MLEQMREQTGSLIIWVLFAIIIAAFVLFFGSPSDSLGCGSTNDYAIEVDDEPVSVHSWRFAYNGMPFVYGNIPADQRKPLALEFLVQREILAQAAEKLDMRVSDAVVDQAIQDGEFYLLGNRVDGTKVYFENSEDDGFFFNYEYLTNLAQSRLGLPNVAAYKEEQRREMMAFMMKRELIRSAYVSKEEARDAFIQNNTTISASYVKFDVLKYRSAVELTESAVQAYIASHEDDLKTEWEQVKPRWESDKARVQARIIKIEKTQRDAPTEDEDPEAPEGDDSEAPVEASAAPDEARLAIDAAREKLVAGASFAEVAAEVSTDRTASLGGLIGWRAAASLGYGQEVVDGTKDLEVGKVSEVIESKSAYFLVVLDDKNDKGLTFEQKKFDLAVKAAPDELARDLAKAAAEAALASAATTPLSELFPAASEPGNIDLNNLPPEILQQLTPEQIQQLMQQGAAGESGAIVTEGPIQYAQLGGEEAAPAAATAAAPPAAAAPTAGALPTPKAAATEEPVAASDEPPAASGVAAPPMKKIQRTTRNGDFIAGIGRSDALVADLFGTLAIGALSSKVYEVEESKGFVVVQLTDRSEADMEQFADQASELQAVLAEAKGGERLEAWVVERCLKLKKAGSIDANPAMLKSSDEKILPYEPCSLMSQAN